MPNTCLIELAAGNSNVYGKRRYFPQVVEDIYLHIQTPQSKTKEKGSGETGDFDKSQIMECFSRRHKDFILYPNNNEKQKTTNKKNQFLHREMA
jgi:hypothetical protein